MREPRVCLQDTHSRAKASVALNGWWVEEIKLAEVTVAVSVWANVGWIATSRDGIATGESALALLLLETASALIGGVGWTWME